MLPTSSDLRRRSTAAHRSSSSGSGGGMFIISQSSDMMTSTSASSTADSSSSSSPRPPPSSPWRLQQHGANAPRAPRMVHSLVSSLKSPRLQALLCLCLAVTPWIHHSSQNHRARSIHAAFARLVREHKQILAGMEHSQMELQRAQRMAREMELDNKELVDALAEDKASAAAYAAQQQQHMESEAVDIDSSGYVYNDGAEETAGSISISSSSIYREAQHLEDLYLERIGIIEAAIRNHSLHHIRQTYLPPQAAGKLTFDGDGGGGGGGDDDDDDAGPSVYVEIRLVAEEEDAAKDGAAAAAAAAAAGAAAPADQVLVLETAPVGVAPHAIDHFLRLVEASYYDGRKFAMMHQPTLLPASMTTKAGSPPYTHRIHTFDRVQKQQQQQQQTNDAHDRTTATNPTILNEGRQLTSTAFTEHRHGAYPVQKYSVIFHGKPGGGPHFSIHMMDPRRPQQQQQQRHPQSGSLEDEGTEEEEGEDEWDQDDDDACFGRIVRGQDVLDRMVEASRATKRQQRIVIDRISLLPGGPGGGW